MKWETPKGNKTLNKLFLVFQKRALQNITKDIHKNASLYCFKKIKILLEVLLLKISIKVKKKSNELNMYLVYTWFSSCRKDRRKKVKEIKVIRRETSERCLE